MSQYRYWYKYNEYYKNPIAALDVYKVTIFKAYESDICHTILS